MASTASHIAATRDADIRERLIAAAEMQGVQSAPFWVEQNIGTLVSVDVDPSDGEASIASVLEYKNLNFERQFRPGEDPSAVTDNHLANAVERVKALTTTVTAVPLETAGGGGGGGGGSDEGVSTPEM